tara:strand:+ start:1666 stop:2142 length:477 start_codon:yes stop_codon:yes gene_type:complete
MSKTIVTVVLVLVAQVIVISNLLAYSHSHKRSKHDADEHVARGQMVQLMVPIHKISVNGVGKQIGTIVLKDSDDGLLVLPNLHSLSAGRHAFHIHEHGNCGPGIYSGKQVAGLAGGPRYGHDSHNKHHGKPAGDFPELLVGVDGVAMLTVVGLHLMVS